MDAFPCIFVHIALASPGAVEGNVSCFVRASSDEAGYVWPNSQLKAYIFLPLVF